MLWVVRKIIPLPHRKEKTTKVKYRNTYDKEDYRSIADFAEHQLDGSDYDTGMVEAARDTARNNSQAIGRLLDILAGKDLLNDMDVLYVIGCGGTVELED